MHRTHLGSCLPLDSHCRPLDRNRFVITVHRTIIAGHGTTTRQQLMAAEQSLSAIRQLSPANGAVTANHSPIVNTIKGNCTISASHWTDCQLRVACTIIVPSLPTSLDSSGQPLNNHCQQQDNYRQPMLPSHQPQYDH